MPKNESSGATPEPTPPTSPGLPRVYTLYCPAARTAPRTARDFVAFTLNCQGLPLLIDDAVLCTSELVTNACVHAKSPAGSVLRIVIDGCGPVPLHVAVYDGDSGTKPRMLQGYAPESGRGLWIVDALTEGRWGTVQGAPLVGGGKGVWFELGVRT